MARRGGASFPGRRSLPVSRENSIVLSAPVGLQPCRRRRYQPAQFTPEGAGLRGSVCVGEGGLSYSSRSRGQNGNGGSGCGTTCFPLAPFRHQGAVFFWEGAWGHEAAKRVATILSQVFPTFPSVTALDMRAICPPEVHHDVGKREMKSFPDTTTFVVRVNKGAVSFPNADNGHHRAFFAPRTEGSVSGEDFFPRQARLHLSPARLICASPKRAPANVFL